MDADILLVCRNCGAQNRLTRYPTGTIVRCGRCKGVLYARKNSPRPSQPKTSAGPNDRVNLKVESTLLSILASIERTARAVWRLASSSVLKTFRTTLRLAIDMTRDTAILIAKAIRVIVFVLGITAAVAIAGYVFGPGRQKPETPQREEPSSLEDRELKGVMPGTRIFELANPSVYTLFVYADARSQAAKRDIGNGSAVAVRAYLALTNCHVLNHGRYYDLVQKHRRIPATIWWKDESRDTCIVRTKVAMQPVKGHRGSKKKLIIGENVFAIGSPLGIKNNLNKGILSQINIVNEQEFLVFSADISPGSSGGGLFDAYGNLIGITKGSLSDKDANNIYLAIPVAQFEAGLAIPPVRRER